MRNRNGTLTISLLCKRVLLAFSMITICGTLAGCASDPTRGASSSVISRDLPQTPDRIMQPVPVPVYQEGQDARAALRLTKSALLEANERLSAVSSWYDDIRHSYSAYRTKWR